MLDGTAMKASESRVDERLNLVPPIAASMHDFLSAIRQAARTARDQCYRNLDGLELTLSEVELENLGRSLGEGCSLDARVRERELTTHDAREVCTRCVASAELEFLEHVLAEFEIPEV